MTWWETQDCHLARSCRTTATVATMQCQSASLCVDSQFSTVLVIVYRADLNSHVQCWTLESVEPSAHPACRGHGEALACVSIHYKRSHAWLPPMHYHCSFKIVYKAITIERLHGNCETQYGIQSIAAVPNQTGSNAAAKAVTVHIRACLLASELLESPLWTPSASQNL